MVLKIEEVFDISNDDQPTTCPKCGSRTEIGQEIVTPEYGRQNHTCLNPNCKHEFITEWSKQ